MGLGLGVGLVDLGLGMGLGLRRCLGGSRPGCGSRPAVLSWWVSAWVWVSVVAEFWTVEWVTGVEK